MSYLSNLLRGVLLLCLSSTLAVAASSTSPKLTSVTPNKAPAGTVVSLAGSNFGTQIATVKFGSKKVEKSNVSLWSNTKITAKVPSGSGTVKVTVTNSKGKTSKSVNFTYGTASGGGGGGGGGGTPGATTGYGSFKVLANNDLGMHCVDKDFSVFSILPPYNVINAQVVGQSTSTGKPKLFDATQVELRFSAVADASGSINTTSRFDKNGVKKSNFWGYAPSMYPVPANFPFAQGLKGLYMPADGGTATQTFGWNTSLGLFAAEGIPILPIDDAGRVNHYPLLKVTAYEKGTGKLLGAVDTVAPVSEETTCSNCHATGKPAASGDGWSTDPDLEVQSRRNVLQVHDLREGTSLLARQPVLCASCHYSPALDLAGTGPVGDQVGKPTMSAVMHDFHAKFKRANGKVLYDEPAPVAALLNDPVAKGMPPAEQQTCYQCHPGASTKCLRGAMTDSVTCQNCHGGMKAVGGATPLLAYGTVDRRSTSLNRHPWGDEPRCQSCHTGDAVNHIVPATAGINNQLASDNIRLMLAFNRDDAAASPLLAGDPSVANGQGNKRFAENDGKLFRFSKGHGGLACEGCHGSTHAIWPGTSATTANDDVTATQLQGHVGTISECATCHKAGSLALGLGGAHGMHNVGDSRWWQNEDSGHPKFYKSNPGECRACHGTDLQGTALSRASTDRSYSTEWGVKTVKKGQTIGCWTCHNGPDDD